MTNTLENDTTEEERAIDVALQAQDAFDIAAELLQDSCKELRTLPTGGDADVTKSLRQLNAAFLLTMDLREKAREAGCKRFGSGGAGTLNLDEARAEIGLRLACLRGSGHGGGRSGGAE